MSNKIKINLVKHLRIPVEISKKSFTQGFDSYMSSLSRKERIIIPYEVTKCKGVTV